MVFYITRLIIAFIMICNISISHLSAQNLETTFNRNFSIEVKNPLGFSRESVKVLLKEEDIKKNIKSFNPAAFVVFEGENEVPSQYVKDTEHEGIVVILDHLEANSSKLLSVRFKEQGVVERNYKKRTQAELSHKKGGTFQNRKYIGGNFENVDYLRVPDEHTDHSFYIRYEGPGWESDKVGYRIYLDWRNAIDVFGKTTDDIILQEVGQDNFDSYHEMQKWGMDVLKVGESLGLGSLATLHNGAAIRVDKTDSVITAITENGNLLSSITTNYFGWKVGGQKYDIESNLSIHGGSRLTHHKVKAKGNINNLCTGIRKEPSARLIKEKGSEKQWGFLATYGKQSLNNDNLGLAVLFSPKAFTQFTEDGHSHIVELKPEKGAVEYYFLAAWELEKEGIKSEKEFMDYLFKKAQELANPVQVSISSRLN